MIRYFLARGDRAGSAVIAEGLVDVTCSNPPPRVNVATLYMRTYCTACKQDGFIAPKGPRWPGTASNGKQWALSGDINVCHCNPPPVFYAKRGMSMSFTAEEAAALVASPRHPNWGSPEAIANTDENLECYYEIVDARTGNPVEGMTYKLSSDSGTLVDRTPLTDGKTRSFPVKDLPNLTFVAWHAGDAR
ncbi:MULTISPECIES: hypothetical protein [Cupriavidus]|jgi:hypothetical protein|uniref:Uncharacterized protein n=1 Tax=Cupriavidus metallidurans TaxID=119219 RepID=A0A132HKF8_9BURK|nr:MULTISPECIES: hypothetical protein [Cupriavidus]KWW37155.1 hypothetical protein AU374_03222 [Cupriavidus metallidurans]QBP09630.1 hypothetical protein DDF84_007575 [Cupriavidus metallidurans]QWC89980.1 hypothetical protein KB891_07255 [Cupriavidus metallidurans]